MTAMEVTTPTDVTALDYALEEVVEEARENGLDDDIIRNRLSAFDESIKRGDV